MTQSNILAYRSLLARMSVGAYSGRKLDKRESATVAARNGAMGGSARVHKDTIDPKLLQPIIQAASAARLEHYRYTLPWQDDGYRILPSAAYQAHQLAVQPHIDAFWQGVGALCEAWERDDVPSQGQRLLGALWRAEDYPSVAVLRSRYRFDFHVRPMPSSEDWRVTLSETDMERFKQEAQGAQEAVLRELWTRVHDACAHMAEVLAKPDGRVYTSLFERAKEVATLMPALNVTNDPQLDAVARDILARLVPSGDPEREADTMRSASGEQRKARAGDAEAIARKMASVWGG